MVFHWTARLSTNNTINHTIKKVCLVVLESAYQCQAYKEKHHLLQLVMFDLLLVGASQCQTWNHSHSIVAGGLLETS